MTLFTGRGDDGTSTLFVCEQAKRLSKADVRFDALGMLDELNTLIGWCAVVSTADDAPLLREAQDHLFTLQAEVAGAKKTIPQSSVDTMSARITTIGEALPPITTFLLPGGTEYAARLDIARAVTRRVERRIVALNESEEGRTSLSSGAYLNRLSSLLYALARRANQHAGIVEHPPQYRDTSD
jgi:cob(I)alamin adenosyltransferase